MDEFDELAGRIEGVARALLHLTAELEDRWIIDGPRLARGWRQSLRLQRQDTALRLAAQRTLQELAQALDGARSLRRAGADR